MRSSAISFARIRKNEFGLQLSKAGVSPNISRENELSESFATNYTNLSEVNRQLTDVLLNYYITSNDDTRYLIQFDRLDDCYNQYQTVEEYYQLIISLLKSIYNLNNAFRVKKIDSVKTVVYIRSDIVFEIQKRDAESARWDDFAYKLNWTIINHSDWNNPLLLQMINKRITCSIGEEYSFNSFFDKRKVNLKTFSNNRRNSKVVDVFKYAIDRTLHRPRDLIQFCKCIQNELRQHRIYGYQANEI